ncbi:MAG TPA: GTP 3',8-cyclase MoaA [Cytophagaceae bacterium]|nr:GTP 3',8-cyclase MoaA [Cytophagaceae bacterium]
MSYLNGMIHQPIVDPYGRSFRTLRVSLTNACNLGCIYCVHPDQKSNSFPTKKTLDAQELATLIKKIHSLTTLDTVRLTGGEPTLYKDLLPLVHMIKASGISQIKMTSNGSLLKPLIPGLSEVGLKSINISLDAVDEKSFQQIALRKNISPILEAIDEALRHGIKIKLNAVILRSINEDQIIPLLKFAQERVIPLRFLELMRMGPLYQHKEFQRYFFSETEILQTISEYTDYTPLLRQPSATANYWKTSNGFTFGIIANESSPFCADCNRLRLDSFGNIFGCLSDDTAISVKEVLENENLLEEKLRQALSQKQPLKFTGSALSMRAIGG